ncbi:MAG: triphosphoribosyl-dephospho-CoA synthase [Bacteriovorax sp.]|nr:triphosphoribosyl-dephospho-CoA synthase [Rhizobacter sp.]
MALGRRFGSLALLCAPSQGVLHPPSIDRRATMALAAPRDCIARQYRDGLVDLFTFGLPALGAAFSLRAEAAGMVAVQQASLRLPGGCSDSHIVRNTAGPRHRLSWLRRRRKRRRPMAVSGPNFWAGTRPRNGPASTPAPRPI